MIDQALKAIANRLNTHLKNKLSINKDKVVVSNILKTDGNSPNVSSDSITVTLVSLSQERNIKNLPSNPADAPIYLNMHILVSVYFGEDGSYEQALKELSAIISFFQANQVFTPQNTPDLNSNIEKLVLIMADSNIQQDQNMWTMLGGKYTPSVLYKANMIALHEDRVNFGGVLGT